MAGISSRQIDESKGSDIATTATMPMPLRWRPESGAAASYERVREQARVQVAGWETGVPVYVGRYFDKCWSVSSGSIQHQGSEYPLGSSEVTRVVKGELCVWMS